MARYRLAMTYAPDVALIATPVGMVRVEGGEVVTRITITAAGPPSRGAGDAVRAAAEQIAQYFAGERCDFDLPLASARTLRGAVLRAAIVAVPFGKTARYGEIAAAIGSSARAIGQACRTNPFPIVVPCHRIVGGTGHYSAGDGIVAKNRLLDHERERNAVWVR